MKTSFLKLASAALLLSGTSFVCAEDEAPKAFELPMGASEPLAQYESLLRDTVLPHATVAYDADDFEQHVKGIVDGERAFEAEKELSESEKLWHALMWAYLKHHIAWIDYVRAPQDEALRDASMKTIEALSVALSAYQDYIFEKYPEKKAEFDARMDKLQQEVIEANTQQGHPADATQPATEL